MLGPIILGILSHLRGAQGASRATLGDAQDAKEYQVLNLG